MKYLSDAWLDRAAIAVAGVEPVDEAFSIAYVVTDGPDGDRSYTLQLGPDAVTVRFGVDAPVTLQMTWTVACGIARGELSAQRAFLDGDMRIGGDAQALVGTTDSLAAVDDALTELRATTTY